MGPLTEQIRRIGDHHGVGSRAAVTLLVLVALASPALADDLYDRLWPRVPDAQGLTLEDQIVEHLSDLGNQLGYHVDVLSKDMIGLHVDGRRQRAYVRVGNDNHGQYLTFKLASDVEFTDGLARFATKVDLGIAGRTVHFKLPEVEMAPTSYRGERGVELRLPLFRRRF